MDTSNFNQHQPVIIVGGGLAGLTAAVYLARAGRPVTLFEKANRPGGRAETQVKSDYHFNLGPHAQYRGGVGKKVLRELGIDYHGRPPQLNGYAIKNYSRYALPANLGSLIATGLVGLRAKIELGRVMAGLAKIDPEPLQGISLRSWLERELHQPEAREVVQAMFRLATYTSNVDQFSAGAAIAQAQLAQADNVDYIDGGWQTLVDGLRQAAEMAGAKIMTGSRVSSIEWGAAEGVRGVRLADGARYEAAQVLVAASPGVTAALVEHSQATVLARWAEQSEPVMAATLDLGLRYLPDPQTTFALGIDRPLYLSVHSGAAQLAPEGGALIHVARYLHPSDTASPQENEAELAGLLDLVQPGWQKAVVERRFLPRMVVSNALVSAAQGGAPGRPGPEVPGIPGLYVAGDWVGPTGLLSDASFASARQAAQLMLAAKERQPEAELSLA